MKGLKKLFLVSLSVIMAVSQVVPASAAAVEKRSNLVSEDLLYVTDEITIGNLIDFHYMVPGQEKYQVISINPQGAEITVSSGDDSIAVAEVVDTPAHITGNQDLTCTANTPNERDDTREIKVTALTEGKTEITVTAEKAPYKETSVTFEVNVLPEVQEGTQRFDVGINKDWQFALEKDYQAGQFEAVDLPHTWNIDDVENQLGKHYGVGYYRKIFTFPKEEYENREVFIDFGAANKVSELYINGKLVGKHEGGYARFRYHITDFIELDKENVILMKVDNTIGGTVMPLSGGFAYHGSIYRDSYVTATDQVTFDKLDYGSSSVYLTQKEVSEASAKLNVKAGFMNYGDAANVEVKAVVFEEDGVTEVASYNDALKIDANAKADFVTDFVINQPHLWNGVKDPYQYVVEVTLVKDGVILERQRERIGFRFFEVLKVDDPRAAEGAFLLNGKPYRLAGVAQHQDRENMGNAITHKEMDEDIAFVSEIGATCLRLSHYQHDRYMYELASERGIVTWAEIPNVNTVGSVNDGEVFLANAKQQLTELIRQNYNATGIFMWGIHNEQWPKADIWVNKVLDALYKLGHEEDATRYVAVATAQSETTPLSWQSDISAWNKYFGWYEGANIDGFGSWADNVKNYALNNDTSSYKGSSETFTAEVNKTIGMSEYGTGNNIWTHELFPPNHVKSISEFQSEEYANKYHEITWKQIKERPWLWGTFIWNMFDFSQPGVVSEGGIVSRNTKGLMSFDRSLKKDQFYFYKANWSEDPTVYISSRRFDKRYDGENYVRVYSNMDEVELFVNGVSAGLIKRTDAAKPNTAKGNLICDPSLGIFHFDGDLVQLNEFGDYEITAVGRKVENGAVTNEYEDTAVVSRMRDYRVELASSVYIIDTANKTISKVPSNETVESFLKNVTAKYNGSVKLLDAAGNEAEDLSALISKDMQVVVFAEDGEHQAVYTLADSPISAGASAEVSTTQSPHVSANLTDGDVNTRWTASSNQYPQHFILDLGEVTDIYQFSSLFYGEAPRAYLYTISTSADGNVFTKVVDRSNNTESKWVTDKLSKPVSARYVRMDFSGCKNASGNAALWEFMVYGCRLNSDAYVTDSAAKEILGVRPSVTADELLKKISVVGNYESVGIADSNGNPVAGNAAVGKDAVLWIAVDGGRIEYRIKESIATEIPVSQNKSVSEVVDVKPGNSASYINDGDSSTFWNATNGFDPVRYAVIDLGADYYLTKTDIEFYQGGSKRYYGYRILGSTDGKNYTQFVDRTGNKDKEKDSHDIASVVRYLKVEVTGTTPVSANFAAAVRELKAYGWKTSDYYNVNHEEKTISNVVDMTSTEQFFNLLELRGNFIATLKQNGEEVPDAKFVRDGMTLCITDMQGNGEAEYTIVAGMNTTPISRNKPAKGEIKEGSSPSYAVDGDMATFWNGPMADPNNATYPVNLEIDLAEGETVNDKKIEYNLTKVVTNWYESGGRTYQFEYIVKPALGLPIVWHDGNQNDVNGEVIVTDATNNGSDVKVSEFNILVNGRTPNNSYWAAAIREVDIYGWYLGSTVYEVNDTSITAIPENTDVETFRENLDIRGNYLYVLLDAEGNAVTEGVISDGMKVRITDIDGNTFDYVLETAVSAPDTYYVEVVNGTVADGEPTGDYLYNTKLTVKANAPEEGKVFAGWKVNGKLLSTETEYTFFVGSDLMVEAVYAEEAAELAGAAYLQDVNAVKREDGRSDIRYLAQLTLPEGAKLADAGLVWSNKGEEFVQTVADVTSLTELPEGVKLTHIAKISTTLQFSVTIKGVPSKMTVPGKIFATYTLDGETYTVYSEVGIGTAK